VTETPIPHATIDALPPSVRKHLPATGQDIYREAFNHAWATYARNPRHGEIAHRTARARSSGCSTKASPGNGIPTIPTGRGPSQSTGG
jgi:cation transport regulator